MDLTPSEANVAQPFEKFPTFYETGKLTAVFTRAYH
jgi:hypothetical protein